MHGKSVAMATVPERVKRTDKDDIGVTNILAIVEYTTTLVHISGIQQAGVIATSPPQRGHFAVIFQFNVIERAAGVPNK